MWRFLSLLKGRRANYMLVDGIPYDVSTEAGAKAYERACDESCDIYKIVARVRNHVTAEGMALTGLGLGLTNTVANFLYELHNFAAKIDDPELYLEFKEILKKHEKLPAIFIKWATPRKDRE